MNYSSPTFGIVCKISVNKTIKINLNNVCLAPIMRFTKCKNYTMTWGWIFYIRNQRNWSRATALYSSTSWPKLREKNKKTMEQKHKPSMKRLEKRMYSNNRWSKIFRILNWEKLIRQPRYIKDSKEFIYSTSHMPGVSIMTYKDFASLERK